MINQTNKHSTLPLSAQNSRVSRTKKTHAKYEHTEQHKVYQNNKKVTSYVGVYPLDPNRPMGAL